MYSMQFPKKLSPRNYEDIKILKNAMLSVKEKGQWKVVNIKNEIILNYGFDDIKVLNEEFLSFKKDRLWGIVNRSGQKFFTCLEFDKIDTTSTQHFLTFKKGNTGLLNPSGKTILSPRYEEIRIESNDLIFHKKEDRWGAVDSNGSNLLDNEFQSFSKITPNFYEVSNGMSNYLYSVSKKEIINTVPYENYFPFPGNYILVKKGKGLGLMDGDGRWILDPYYNEIQPYGKNYFRARKQNLWGILDKNEQEKIPFNYKYIAPLKGKLCLVKKAEKFGVFNILGEEVISPNYSKIELEKNRAKAYKPEMF